jgi:hypothetical protein
MVDSDYYQKELDKLDDLVYKVQKEYFEKKKIFKERKRKLIEEEKL